MVALVSADVLAMASEVVVSSSCSAGNPVLVASLSVDVTFPAVVAAD